MSTYETKRTPEGNTPEERKENDKFYDRFFNIDDIVQIADIEQIGDGAIYTGYARQYTYTLFKIVKYEYVKDEILYTMKNPRNQNLRRSYENELKRDNSSDRRIDLSIYYQLNEIAYRYNDAKSTNSQNIKNKDIVRIIGDPSHTTYTINEVGLSYNDDARSYVTFYNEDGIIDSRQIAKIEDKDITDDMITKNNNDILTSETENKRQMNAVQAEEEYKRALKSYSSLPLHKKMITKKPKLSNYLKMKGGKSRKSHHRLKRQRLRTRRRHTHRLGQRNR